MTSPHPTPLPRSAAAGRLVVPVVHAVTTDAIVALPDFLDRAHEVMHALGPRGAVQLRAHHTPAHRLYEVARRLAAIQELTGAWLVLNDRVDVALAVGARGAQLTSRSMTVADARRIAPALAVGASVHDVPTAEEAARAGAAWVVAGHVFATASHPGEAGRGPSFVRELVARLGRPAAGGVAVVAIGGVLPEHVPELRALGAHGVAAIRGIWEASDAARAATDYLSGYDASGGG